MSYFDKIDVNTTETVVNPITAIPYKRGVVDGVECWVPQITAPEPIDIGRYGRMRLRYLKECRRADYTLMRCKGTLWEHCAEVNREVEERIDRDVKKMAKKEGVQESWKDTDTLRWVGAMNNIRNRAEEIIFRELIYT